MITHIYAAGVFTCDFPGDLLHRHEKLLCEEVLHLVRRLMETNRIAEHSGLQIIEPQNLPENDPEFLFAIRPANRFGKQRTLLPVSQEIEGQIPEGEYPLLPDCPDRIVIYMNRQR